jgi:polyisoprenoid-binding protein YceI
MTRCLVLILLAAPLASAAKDWQPDAKSSHLRFSGTQQGEAFGGEFTRFTAKVALDPGKPADTRIEAEIDVVSANTKNAERDETLATPDFFWAAKFPKAKFRTLSCKAGGAGKYDCEAELTIRDKTRKIAFPFTFAEAGGGATLKAEVTLDRTQFDVGTGEWADDGTIAHQVKVSVDLSLK